MVIRRFLAAALLCFAMSPAVASAERPIVDLHKLDAYFALFAGDSSVPWRPTSIRLDTYSSAPVAFSVYQVDPADVLSAGSNERARAIDTRGRRAVVSFSYVPPGGYQFQSNTIDVRLGNREGFFVVEARRGNVGEQVWINRTRVGLFAKGTSSELLVYGADLGTGRAIPGMRVQFVVGNRFDERETDRRGIVEWSARPRPVFALAQWGSSYAFLSLLPQAPVSNVVVGVRTDSAVVHAGDTVRVVGFARVRSGNVLRPASGTVSVVMRLGATAIGEQNVTLDQAGAFVADIPVPAGAAAGDYALLAQTGGGIGGATVHVDANSGGLSLSVGAQCGTACDPYRDVPLEIRSSEGDRDVRVTVVRSPHVFVNGAPDGVPWATAKWLDTTVRTGSDGRAEVAIPHPTDDLASTYGVVVSSGGATANTRIVVPTARAAVVVHVDSGEQTVGTPLGFDVYANSTEDGKPVAGATVTMQLVHGQSVQQQQLRLDGSGHARGSFSSAQLGTILVFARLTTPDGQRAADAAQVSVVAQAAFDPSGSGSPNVRIALDRGTYHSGDGARIDASLDGAQGDALLTLDSALDISAGVVPVAGGRASANLRVRNSVGALRAAAAFVRDGSIEWNASPLVLDAPGRPALVGLEAAPSFSPGQSATVTLRDQQPGAGTAVVRLSRGDPSGSALFDSAPGLLDVGLATTQNSAPPGVTWHPWVDSTGSHAQVIGFVARTSPPQDLTVAQAATQAVSWSVARVTGSAVPVQMPQERGRYTLSVLKISDDGRVTASSSVVVVQ